jgi:transcriptional regulator with XRE-family HTH domain
MTDSEPFDPWKTQVEAFGRYLKAQRNVSDLSLRELGRMTNLSNAYLSQLERGLHEPSLRVMRSLADALGIPLETLLEQTGWSGSGATEATSGATESAIRTDPLLSDAQKEALLAVYGSYVAEARRRASDEG